MKKLKNSVGLFCINFCFLVPHTVSAQNSPGSEMSGQFGLEKKLIATVGWRVAGKQGHFRCEVTQVSSTTDVSFTRVLTIYREENGKLTKVFAFETSDALLNAYPLGDYDGRLFTTWIGGSAYHIRVFAFVDGQVTEPLEEGSRLAPEFLYDEHGRESILITAPIMQNGNWTPVNGTTTVFKWNGHKYENLGTVPWENRLQCLSKESCASAK